MELRACRESGSETEPYVAGLQGSTSWWRKYPEWWVALLLMIASIVFVSTFASFARWQFGYPYHTTSDLCRWDCTWFRAVADEGYDRIPQRFGDKADWSFFPLFPLSAAPFKLLARTPTRLALVYASRLEMYLAIVCFLLMVRKRIHVLSDYFMAGSLIAFNPYLIYGHAGYSEPLYLALTCLAFFFLAEELWIPSGVAAALLSATRIVGCLFTLAYLVVAIRAVGPRQVLRQRNLNILIGLFLCPLGLAVYMLFLHHRMGDALAFGHIQVAWNRTPGSPLVVVLRALRAGHWSRIWAVMALVGAAAVGWLLKERRPELAVFLAAAILAPLTADTWGFARYLWWQAPWLYAVFTLIQRRRSSWPIYIAFAAGMAGFMVIEWFSGTSLVV